jgi:3-deoxy-D-manno-octulosonic-acid transferase
MPYLINALYAMALAALFPWLFLRSILTGRYRKGVLDKLFGLQSFPGSRDKPTVWFHGVSVGEVHLLSVIVAAFRKRFPHWQCVVSSTTDTGLTEAQKRFADLIVIPFPFDFSWAVNRSLKQIQPKLIVLAESELWPNFLRAANEQKVPVIVVNGRMSPRSLKRYSKLSWLAQPLLFSRITRFAMQTESYAQAMEQLGVERDRLRVTGSVKYDGASGDRDQPGTRVLRQALNLKPTDRVWVAGSTHAPEEQIVLEVFRKLRVKHPELRLILVPRSPDRFGEVARLIEKLSFSFVRRSQVSTPRESDHPAVILLDTMGELGAAWGLADVGFTGGSLDGQRGGQSMIEPAAFGVPVVFGPFVWNFRDAAQRLIDAGAACMVRTPQAMEQELLLWLDDERLRTQKGLAARRLVQEQQGATERTMQMIDELIATTSTVKLAA